MTAWSTLSAWWRGELKASAVGRLVYHMYLGRAQWTPRQYERLAEEGYVRNAVAYRCIRLIAEAAANVPWLLYEGKRELSEHPLLELLRFPNRFQGGFELMDAFYHYTQIAGNSYLEQVPLGGQPRELFVLRPDRMKIELGPRGYPSAYVYTVGSSNWSFPVPERPDQQGQVLHFKMFHPTNDHYGLAPVEGAAYAIDQHAATSEFNKALLDNRATPSGALQSDSDLTEDQYQRLKSDMDERYQGKQNAGRPMLLEGGLKWQAIAFSPKDMEIIEGRRELAREIAFSFGVPPMLLGIPGDNTYSNYQEANRAFYRSTVLPLLDRGCDALTNFFRPTWPGIKLWYDIDQIEALQVEREAAWTRANAAQFLTVDEKREMVGYARLPDKIGEVVLIPGGMTPLEMVGFEPGGGEEDEPDEPPDEGDEGKALRLKFTPGQPRDKNGRWVSGVGISVGGTAATGGVGAQVEEALGARLNAKGKPDPTGEFAANPLKPPKGQQKEDEYVAGFINDEKNRGLYESTETVDARTVLSPQKLVIRSRVTEYVGDAGTAPKSRGDGASDIRVAKSGGRHVLNDGNHRVVAAALKNEKITVTSLDMDKFNQDLDKHISAQNAASARGPRFDPADKSSRRRAALDLIKHNRLGPPPSAFLPGGGMNPAYSDWLMG